MPASPKWVSTLRWMRTQAVQSFVVAALFLAVNSPCAAQQFPVPKNKLELAPVPPMGWNSWDSYAETITEAQVRANADFMARHLKQFGWQYVVIDEGWYVEIPGAKPADVKRPSPNTRR